MASYSPPTYFISNGFNSSFFSTVGIGLTLAKANSLYLQKTITDTCTASENFAGGLLTNNITTLNASPLVISGNGLTINTSGILGIQTTASFSSTILDNTGAVGANNQVLSSTGSGVLWKTIATPSLGPFQTTTYTSSSIINIPATTVRIMLTIIGGGGLSGSSLFTNPNVFVGGSGGGGGVMHVYNVFCNSTQQLNISNTGSYVSVALLGSSSTYNIVGATGSIYPLALGLSNYGSNGITATGTNNGIFVNGGTCISYPQYTSTVSTGTPGTAIVSVALSNSTNNLGGGNFLANNISSSVLSYALGSSITKSANSSTTTPSVSGTGAVIVYYYNSY